MKKMARRITVSVLAVSCVLSLTGCGSLFGIATPPPPYPEGFTIADGFGVDLSDPKSIQAAYQRHMLSLTGADYVGNPAFSNNISEIVSAKPEWSRAFQNFQIVDYDVEENLLVYAYQTTLKVQDGNDYKIPDVEIAPIDYKVDPQKKSPTVIEVKDEKSNTVPEEKKKLISAVGTYRWKDDKGKAVKESTIFFDTDTLTNKAVVSELGSGNKNLIVKKINKTRLAICYNDQIMLYDYKELKVNVTKDGKTTQEVRKSYVPTLSEGKTTRAYSLKDLKKWVGYVGINHHNRGDLEMYTSYRLAPIQKQEAQERGAEKQLYQIMDEITASLVEKEAYAEYLRVYNESYARYVEEQKNNSEAVWYPNTCIVDYLVKAANAYGAKEDKKPYQITAYTDGYRSANIKIHLEGMDYYCALTGGFDNTSDETVDGKIRTLVDLEIYQVKKPKKPDAWYWYYHAWNRNYHAYEKDDSDQFLVIAQYRIDEKQKKQETPTPPIEGSLEKLQNEGDISIDQKVEADAKAEYVVIAGLMNSKSYYEGNSSYENGMQMVQITNNVEMNQAFLEEKERIKEAMKAKISAYATEVKFGAQVDVSERNVEDLETILTCWEGIVACDQEIREGLKKINILEEKIKKNKKEQGQLIVLPTQKKEEEELRNQQEELQNQLEKSREKANGLYQIIVSQARSVKITYKDQVYLDPENLLSSPPEPTEEALENLKTVTGLYKDIRTSASQIEEGKKLFSKALENANNPYYEGVLNQLPMRVPVDLNAAVSAKSTQALGDSFHRYPWNAEKLSDVTYIAQNYGTFLNWLNREEQNLNQVKEQASKIPNLPINLNGIIKHPYEDGFLVYCDAVKGMKIQLENIKKAYETLSRSRSRLTQDAPMQIVRFDQLTFDDQEKFLLGQCDRMQVLIQQVNQGDSDKVILDAKKELSETIWKIELTPGIGSNSVLKAEVESTTKEVRASTWTIEEIMEGETAPIIFEKITESILAVSNSNGDTLVLNLQYAEWPDNWWEKGYTWLERRNQAPLVSLHIRGSDRNDINQLVSGVNESGNITLLGSGEYRPYGNNEEKTQPLFVVDEFESYRFTKTGYNPYWNVNDHWWSNGTYNKTKAVAAVPKYEEKSGDLDIDKEKIYAVTGAPSPVQTDTDFLSKDHTVFLPDSNNVLNCYFLNISTQEGVVLYRLDQYKKQIVEVYRITDNCSYNHAVMGGGYFRGWLEKRGDGRYNLVLLGFCKEDTKTEINGAVEYREIVPDDIYKAHIYKMNLLRPTEYEKMGR